MVGTNPTLSPDWAQRLTSRCISRIDRTVRIDGKVGHVPTTCNPKEADAGKGGVIFQT